MKPKIRFYLLICSDELDPETISTRLGLNPTGYNRKGDVWRKRTGELHPFNSWEVSTELEESWDLNDQIKKVYDQLLPAKEALACLIAEQGNEGHFNSKIEMYGDATPAIYLGKYIVDFASELGIDFDFDTYIYDDEENEG